MLLTLEVTLGGLELSLWCGEEEPEAEPPPPPSGAAREVEPLRDLREDGRSSGDDEEEEPAVGAWTSTLNFAVAVTLTRDLQ